MKILIAPDSYKASLSSNEICEIFKNTCINQVITCPLADGGEGTVNAIVSAKKGKFFYSFVLGPNYNRIKAKYGVIYSNTVVIEVASCCGMTVVEKKNPYFTTTYGLGQLIRYTLDKGFRNFIIGLGGSCTNDAGLGLLRALGAKFYDRNRKIIKNARDIGDIYEIDLNNFDKRVKKSKFLIACDVTNTFTGPNGASFMYGKQKGANDEMIKKLDSNFSHLEKILNQNLNFLYAGAAGGLGACFKVFFDAKLVRGFDLITKMTNLEQKIQKADLVITGEGRSDIQTKYGKAPYGVLKLAKKYNKPVYLISGRIEDEEELKKLSFDKLIEISPKNINIFYAIKNSKKFLINTIKILGL